MLLRTLSPSICRDILMAGATILALFAGTHLPSASFAQGSLSGAESGRAETLLSDEFVDPYLQSDYYKQLVSDDDIYGKLPEDLRRIFARIRFIALSIDNNAASDQVLNALTRAYLIYGMEAAAINEAIKIFSTEWRARSLVDISDFYNQIGDQERRDLRLQEALDILYNAENLDPISSRQSFFDIASRMALSGKDEISKSIIINTFKDPIHQIIGFLQIAERVHLGIPSNDLFDDQTQSLSSIIQRCNPKEIFKVPTKARELKFSLNKTENSEKYNEKSRFYLLASYAAFEKLYGPDNHLDSSIIQDARLQILIKLNQVLYEYDYKERAHNILKAIMRTFFSDKSIHLAQAGARKPENVLKKHDLIALRNHLIGAFIRTDQVQSGMDLTRSSQGVIELSQAYISAGEAHNEMENFDAATALFNYAQDISDLVRDSKKRDMILDDVVRGQSQAQLYGSAFKNISNIVSEDARAQAFSTMTKLMLFNNNLSSAVQLAKYVKPHDLRIQLYANLAYVRTLFPETYYQNSKTRMPPLQELFDEINNLMNTRLVGGEDKNLNMQSDAIRAALCADIKRQEMQSSKLSGNLKDDIENKKNSDTLVQSAVEYTANIDNAIMRAKSFSEIAQLLIENNDIEQAQFFLDTAWNLAWSIRVSHPVEADNIFLRIVRGKIISNQLTDAFNIATGMSAHIQDSSEEIYQDEVTGEVSYSDRIQALMDFSRMAMVEGEYSISLRAIESIGEETAKSVAMTSAIRDLIKEENSANIDGTLQGTTN